MTRRRLGALVLACCLVAGTAACSGSGTASPLTPAEITAALRRQAGAVRSHDRAAFAAGLDDAPAARGFRERELAAFDNLRSVPLARWTYTVAAPVHAADAQATARTTFGPSAQIVKVTLTFAIRGVDPIATQQSLWWTLARVDGHVVVCADDGLALQGGVSWQGPWDFGPIGVVTGAHSLVLGPAGEHAELAGIADAVDAAVPAVTAVWGTRWARDVEVVVPSTSASLAAALGEDAPDGAAASGAPADVAAVAVSDGQDVLTGQAEGERVVVVPAAFDSLSPLGRRIVLTHEITHVASAAATGGASPRWLVEGFADYVADLHTGQPVRTVAGELVTRIRHDGLPGALPSDDAFDATATTAAAYEEGWLACRLIAARAGTAGLVRFYRLVGASGMSTQTAVAGATRAVLHESVAGFTAQWRAYLASEVGP